MLNPKKPKRTAPQKKKVVVVKPTTTSSEDDDSADARGRNRGRQLVYDEKMGEVVVKRKRKGSRRREDWDDFEFDDY